jgi:hypothetical protein
MKKQQKLPGVKESSLTLAAERYFEIKENIRIKMLELRVQLAAAEKALIQELRKVDKTSIIIDDVELAIDISPECEVIKCRKAK